MAGPNSPASLRANALALSAETFLRIALSGLLPQLQFHTLDLMKLSSALLAGLGLMAISAVGEPSLVSRHTHLAYLPHSPKAWGEVSAKPSNLVR